MNSARNFNNNPVIEVRNPLETDQPTVKHINVLLHGELGGAIEKEKATAVSDEYASFVQNASLSNDNLKENSQGVLFYSLKDLFSKVEQDRARTFIIRCSYFEIYNDSIYDLLQEKEEKLSEPLTLNEDMKKKEF